MLARRFTAARLALTALASILDVRGRFVLSGVEGHRHQRTVSSMEGIVLAVGRQCIGGWRGVSWSATRARAQAGSEGQSLAY